jgi:hypothetical protein
MKNLVEEEFKPSSSYCYYDTYVVYYAFKNSNSPILTNRIFKVIKIDDLL